jgi:hypothetical protein
VSAKESLARKTVFAAGAAVKGTLLTVALPLDTLGAVWGADAGGKFTASRSVRNNPAL